MQRAVFFSGCGTAYSFKQNRRGDLEIYPETLPALRFLRRRGFIPVLVTPLHQEYKAVFNALKGQKIPLLHWDMKKMDHDQFLEIMCIDRDRSFFISDGAYLKWFLNRGYKIILVLTGRGVVTLEALGKETPFCDICKDIYTAAFSIALHH